MSRPEKGAGRGGKEAREDVWIPLQFQIDAGSGLAEKWRVIHVIATVELVEGKRADFLKAFKAIKRRVLAERGCREYGAAVDLPTQIPGQQPVRAQTVVVIEEWASVAALERHLQAPHMLAFFAQIGPFSKSVRIQVLEPAG